MARQRYVGGGYIAFLALALLASNQAVALGGHRLGAEQLFGLGIQGLGQFERHGNGRRAHASLHLRQVALGQSGLLGQLLQGYPHLLAQNSQLYCHPTLSF
ncbi:hypothetical protein D3C84_1127270 [compost metagenome]